MIANESHEIWEGKVLEFASSYYSAKGTSNLSSIQCPVLALNGEKDCQVLAEKKINVIREKLISSGNQNCETGLPSEYGQIEETFDQKTLDIISDWILQKN